MAKRWRVESGIKRNADGSTFYATVSEAKGSKRSVQRSFTTLDAAREWRADAREAREAGLPVPEPRREAARATPTYEQLAKHPRRKRFGRGRRPGPETQRRQMRDRELHVFPVIGSIPVDQVRYEDVEAIVDRIVDKELSRSTCSRVLQLVRKDFEFGITLDLVGRNPAAHVPSDGKDSGGPVEVYVSMAAMVAVTALLVGGFQVAAWLQRGCGLRLGEALGLRISDIDYEYRTVSPRDQRSGSKVQTDHHDSSARSYVKGGLKSEAAQRVVPVPNLVWELLTEYIDRVHRDDYGNIKDPEAFLCQTPRGVDGSGGYAAAVKRSTARLGLTDKNGRAATTHCLRKSYSTDLDRPHIRGKARSQVLGHANRPSDGEADVTATTYSLDKLPEDLQQVVDQIDEQLAGIETLRHTEPVVSYDDERWMTVEDAKGVLGLDSPEGVRHLIRTGTLKVRQFKAARQPNQLLVDAESVQEERRQRDSLLSLADLSRRYGISPTPMQKVLRALGIATIEGRVGYARVWVDKGDLPVVSAHFAAREEFLRDHVTMDEASHLLRCSSRAIRGLASCGTLEEVPVPDPILTRGMQGGGRARFLTRQSVTEEMARRGIGACGSSASTDSSATALHPGSRNKGPMPIWEAAWRMGLSVEYARTLVRAGDLVRLHRPGKGVWVDAASVDEWLIRRRAS